MSIWVDNIPLLTPNECDTLIASAKVWVPGTVVNNGKTVENRETRSVGICRDDLPEAVLDKIFKTVFLKNSITVRFHLEGYDGRDRPHIFKYTADESGHYDWHTDCIRHPDRVRKMSFSIQLSESDDYDGGDLEFMPSVTVDNIRKRGTMTVFPSYMMHRVTPVTRGTRYAAVGWIYGPNFR